MKQFGNYMKKLVFTLSFLSLGVAHAEYWEIPKEKLSMSYDATWQRDYKEASKIAESKNKPMLIVVTGLDWCPWSKKVFEEIIREKEFTRELEEEFVLTWIDYPKQYVQLDEECKEIKAFQKEFKPQKLPIFYLVDSRGYKIAQVGQLPLKAGEFARYVRHLRADYYDLTRELKKIDFSKLSDNEIESLYQRAEALGNEEYCEKILNTGLNTNNGCFFLLEKYAKVLDSNKRERGFAKNIRDAIIKRDPANQQGALLQLAILEFENLSHHLKQKDNPEIAIEPLLNFMKRFGGKNSEWQLEKMIAEFLFSKNRVQKALEHAQRCLQTAPEDRQEEIEELVEYIKINL